MLSASKSSTASHAFVARSAEVAEEEEFVRARLRLFNSYRLLFVRVKERKIEPDGVIKSRKSLTSLYFKPKRSS